MRQWWDLVGGEGRSGLGLVDPGGGRGFGWRVMGLCGGEGAWGGSNGGLGQGKVRIGLGKNPNRAV
jgi:hypothetical protein